MGDEAVGVIRPDGTRRVSRRRTTQKIRRRHQCCVPQARSSTSTQPVPVPRAIAETPGGLHLFRRNALERNRAAIAPKIKTIRTASRGLGWSKIWRGLLQWLIARALAALSGKREACRRSQRRAGQRCRSAARSAAINPMVKEKMVKPSSKPMAPDWSMTKRQMELFIGQVLPHEKAKLFPFCFRFTNSELRLIQHICSTSRWILHKCGARRSPTRDAARRSRLLAMAAWRRFVSCVRSAIPVLEIVNRPSPSVLSMLRRGALTVPLVGTEL